MHPLYTQEEFNNAPSNTLLSLACDFCNQTFVREKKFIKTKLKHRSSNMFCSNKCSSAIRKTSKEVTCSQCGIQKTKYLYEITDSKSGKNFCSQSCSATYNNTHKTTGYRRSKFEIMVEETLQARYSDLQIEYNRSEAIGYELDVYIPKLQLAFEINGIFHYKAIYGDKKLESIQKIDSLKVLLCKEKSINLKVIDISKIRIQDKIACTNVLVTITNAIDFAVD
jgi:hypothetical protein